ncbi:MAG: 30S ribosome-binding factor RbfA [Oscillospiraceae bacterium]|nr:30S ribosome-binding factor RbfA [Oscillospiraceae bacterium]
MANNNMARLNQDMKREIIDIISHMKDPRVQGFLTVTRVEVTPDLSNAKVYISVLGKEDGTKEAVTALNRASGHVRSEVAKRMHIRKSPEFLFIEDDGAAYADRINRVIEGLKHE